MHTLEGKRERLLYLDIVKGIGIILVVLGHSASKEFIMEYPCLAIPRVLLYDVIMPLFFVVAGMLFTRNAEKYKKTGAGKFIAGRAKIFIVPYLSVNVLVYLMFTIAENIRPFKEYVSLAGYETHTITEFFLSILTFENAIDEHLWFAYVMFWVLLLGYFYHIMLSRKVSIWLVLFILLLCYMGTYLFHTPYMVKKIVKYAFYFFVGNVCQEKCMLEKIKGWKAVVLILLFLGSMSIYELKFAGGNAMLPLQCLLLAVTGVAGSFFFLILAKHMGSIKYVAQGLSYCGKTSYPVYLFHQPFIVNGSLAVLPKLGVHPLLTVVIAVILGMGLPLLFYKWILQKNKMLKTIFTGGH